MYSKSQMVPAHYQNKPADCMIACQMAVRLGVDPFMFLQNTYIVSGKPGMEAKLAIALVNSRGPFSGPIQWKFDGQGKTRSCTAYAVHKVTGEVCEATVTWAMVEAEGWNKKPGSKWLSMPDMMFRYRSATFLARLYCPECLMGMMAEDEIIDTVDANVIIHPAQVADGKPRTFNFAKKGQHPTPEARTEGGESPQGQDSPAPPPDLLGDGGGQYEDLILAINDEVPGCTREQVELVIAERISQGLTITQDEVREDVAEALKR
jgi:hypothetical protein